MAKRYSNLGIVRKLDSSTINALASKIGAENEGIMPDTLEIAKVNDALEVERIDQLIRNTGNTASEVADVFKGAGDTTKAVRDLIKVTSKLSFGELLKTTLMTPLVALNSAVAKVADRMATQIVGDAGKNSPTAKALAPFFQAVNTNRERTSLDLMARGNRAIGLTNTGNKPLVKEITTALSVPTSRRLIRSGAEMIQGYAKTGKVSVPTSGTADIRKAVTNAINHFSLRLADLQPGNPNMQATRERVSRTLSTHRATLEAFQEGRRRQAAQDIKSGNVTPAKLDIQPGRKNVIGLFAKDEAGADQVKSLRQAQTVNRLFFQGKGAASSAPVTREILLAALQASLGAL